MPTRLHIAHVLPWPSVGGTEHATLKIAESLRGEFDHTAFCPGETSQVRELFAGHGFETGAYKPVEPSYRHPTEFLFASFRLAREFRRRKIDLVHCSDLLAAYYAGVAGKLARLPVLSQVRCSFPDISRRDRSFLGPIDKFVFVSRSVQQTFSYRPGASRGVVVYDGVDVRERCDDFESVKGVRREFQIPDNTLVVGMVARVAPAKDFETLIRAVEIVVQQHVDVCFLIVGDHSLVPANRRHYEELLDKLAASGLSRYFIFTDHRDDVVRLTGAMDIFVLCTHTEGLPLVILEAMAQAKPVVATDVGGIPELIQDRETGLLHPHGDHKMLAAKLLSLIENESLRKRLGVAAQGFVRTHFSPQVFADGMANVYREMAGEHLPMGHTMASKQTLARSPETNG